MKVSQEDDKSVDKDLDLSMVITAQIIRLLHEARADKDVALSALGAAISHVQCLNRATLI
jgi:hypothetical protein